MTDDRQRTKEFYLTNDFEIPAAFDTADVGYGLFGIGGTPTNYLLDMDGKIVWRQFGYRPGDEREMREAVLGLLDRDN